MIPMNSKRKGDISEKIVQMQFLLKDITVSIPIGDNDKYDLLFDYNGTIHRVQVRTGRHSNGCIIADTRNSYQLSSKTINKEITEKDVDFFAIVDQESQQVYLVPIKEVGKAGVSLRYKAPKKNTSQKIKWAKDYVLDIQLNYL